MGIVVDIAAYKKKLFEHGQNDFATGKQCNENPYKLPWEREEWYLGWLHEKRIVYRKLKARDED